MLYRIAITPDVFIDAAQHSDKEKNLSALWNIFQDNALLADFNDGQWIQYIKQLDMPIASHERVLSHLSRLRDMNRIINCDLPDLNPQNNNDWILLTAKAREKDLVDIVICSERARISSEMQIDDVIDFPVEFSDPVFRMMNEAKNWNLRKTQSDLRFVLEKLFGFSRMVTIVDPFLNCKRPYYQHSIAMLAEVMGKKDERNIERFLNIYTSKKKSGFTWKQFRDYWEPFLRNVAISCKINVSIKLLGASLQNQEQMHDRFLLSEQFGVSLPSDFTIDQKGKERRATWNLLTPEKYATQVREISAEKIYPVKIQRHYYYF